MKRYLTIFVLVVFLLWGLSYLALAKELQVNPSSRIDVPEACPNYAEFTPLPSHLIAINQTTRMASVAQEGQLGDQFVLVIFVVQHEDQGQDLVFILSIMHSDFKDPVRPVTRIFADKEWIEQGAPSGRLIEVMDLPKDIEFYKKLVDKRFLAKKEI
jgi:hypothetical protein